MSPFYNGNAQRPNRTGLLTGNEAQAVYNIIFSAGHLRVSYKFAYVFAVNKAKT